MAKKWAAKRITVNLTRQETDILDSVSQATGMGMTELIRSQIRKLEPKNK